MTFAVTGGSGFFGRALLRRLAERGETARALARSADSAQRVEALGAEVHRGDLTDPTSLRGFVRPGDVLIHAAAHVDLVGRWTMYQLGTVDATRNLLEAALPSRPARVVYVSSAGVYGRLDPRGLCAERNTPQPRRAEFYGRAKLAAEAIVQQHCTQAEVPWCIVRLGFLYGPHNETFERRLRIFRSAGSLSIVGRGDNRIATLYVDDAADAVILAATHPAANGRIYDAASDERVTQAEFMRAHCAALGLGAITRHLPVWLGLVGGLAAELISSLTGQVPDVNRAAVRLMAADQAVDAGRLRRELGWSPRYSFREGIERVRLSQHDAAAAPVAGDAAPPESA